MRRSKRCSKTEGQYLSWKKKVHRCFFFGLFHSGSEVLLLAVVHLSFRSSSLLLVLRLLMDWLFCISWWWKVLCVNSVFPGFNNFRCKFIIRQCGRSTSSNGKRKVSFHLLNSLLMTSLTMEKDISSCPLPYNSDILVIFLDALPPPSFPIDFQLFACFFIINRNFFLFITHITHF